MNGWHEAGPWDVPLTPEEQAAMEAEVRARRVAYREQLSKSQRREKCLQFLASCIAVIYKLMIFVGGAYITYLVLAALQKYVSGH